jgi:hypothetical protein
MPTTIYKSKAVTVKWDDKGILLQARSMNIKEVDKIAQEIVDAAVPPIDTGFLNASGYVHSSSGLNTFDQTWQPGRYPNRAGRLVERTKIDAPEAPPSKGAIAGWAATYSIYVESYTDFAFKAANEVIANRGGTPKASKS